MEKRARQNIAGNIEIRRPQISDEGAQIRGPKAKPILGGMVRMCCPTELRAQELTRKEKR